MIVVVIIVVQWNVNQHHHWTKCHLHHWRARLMMMTMPQWLHPMKRCRRKQMKRPKMTNKKRPKKTNRCRPSYLPTMRRIISIPLWEERIYKFCLPWLSVATVMSHDFPDHKDLPFSKAKAYHSEVKPDAATLKLEVKWCWKAYFSTTHQSHPTNWKIDKCHEYLLSHPIPSSKKADLDF